MTSPPWTTSFLCQVWDNTAQVLHWSSNWRKWPTFLISTHSQSRFYLGFSVAAQSEKHLFIVPFSIRSLSSFYLTFIKFMRGALLVHDCDCSELYIVEQFNYIRGETWIITLNLLFVYNINHQHTILKTRLISVYVENVLLLEISRRYTNISSSKIKALGPSNSIHFDSFFLPFSRKPHPWGRQQMRNCSTRRRCGHSWPNCWGYPGPSSPRGPHH